MAYIPLAEAARSLGLSSSTLRHQIKLGRLRAAKLGPRDWFVTTDEVERYRRESLQKREEVG